MRTRRAAIAMATSLVVMTGVTAAAEFGRPGSVFSRRGWGRSTLAGECAAQAVPLSPPATEAVLSVSPPTEVAWRQGALDVYREGKWLIPPFDEATLVPPPELRGGTRVTARTLGCISWPVPGDLRAIDAGLRGVEYEARTQTISLSGGVQHRIAEYKVWMGNLADADRVDIARAPWRSLVSTGDAVPGRRARALIADAKGKRTMWDRWTTLRDAFEDKRVITTDGHQLPQQVQPVDVERALGSDEAGAWTLLASRALLARWAGIPARIGYGYWRPEPTALFHRFDQAAWLEVMSEDGIWTPLPRDLAVYMSPVSL